MSSATIAGMGRNPESPPPATGRVLAGVAAWLAVAVAVGASGALTRLRPPGPQAVLAGVTVGLLLAIRLSPSLRAFARAVDVRALVAVHLVRFVGFYFLVLHARGALPWAFAVPGGWGDNAVAAGALLLVLLVRPDTRRGRRLYVAWNAVGLADILLVVATAARLAWTDPPSMAPLLRLPLSLLLTFVVPLVVATHLVLFARLIRAAPRPPGRRRLDAVRRFPYAG